MEFDEPNRRSGGQWNLSRHFAFDTMFHEELAQHCMLIQDFDMTGELMAKHTLNYDHMMEYDGILNSPKSISNENVTMNGSCILWAHCAQEMVKEYYSSNATYLQHGLCCEQGGWIVAIQDDMGLDPFDDHGGSVPHGDAFTLLSSLSVLATLRSSMTRFAAAMEPYVTMATTWCMSWLSSYPMTSLGIGAFMVFLLHIGYTKMNKQVKLRSRNHLGPCRRRRWKGNLRGRWQSHLRLCGLIFMTLYLEAGSMDAQQASDMLTRIMDLS
eukprot:s2986_g15.t1